MFSDVSSMTLEELKTGYRYDATVSSYQCLYCDAIFSEAEVYPSGERFLLARAAVCEHVRGHGDALEALLGLGKKVSGLTDNQRHFCSLLARGLADKEIAALLNISPATVRQQRFVLREHAKVARVQLAIFELLEEAMRNNRQRDPREELIAAPLNHDFVDDRFVITKQEEERIIRNAFSSLEPLVLKHIPAKEKQKIVILRLIAEAFEEGRRYSEKEVNLILKVIHSDFAALRRYLINYGYMQRKADCSEYWRV